MVLALVVDGKEMESKETRGVLNPATEEEFTEVYEATEAILDLAFEAAQNAFTSWRQNDDFRRECLLKGATALFSSADNLGKILTQEQGKPLNEAKLEVIGAGVWLKYFSELEIPKEIIQDDSVAQVEVIRKPIGVVSAITPWNFPIVLAAWKIGPALRAGNTMVLKPSPFTPAATLEMGRVLQEAFPPGVLNVISGSDEIGKKMVSHKIPRKISFTGSVSSGKSVALSAANDLKRTTLELGGNDPAIILEDADPDEIGERLFWGAFNNNGQVCSAIKRVYVPKSKYDQFAQKLAEIAKSVKVGNGLDPETRLGPINNKPQFVRVLDLINEAIEKGAKPLVGAKRLYDKGYFVEPTILTEASQGMKIVDEEQFGPALPLISYEKLEDAISMANATNYGLSGSVWGKDMERASEVASQLECGTVWVNNHLILAPHQPFGGFKWSGLGVENGPWGLYSFTEIQVLHKSK